MRTSVVSPPGVGAQIEPKLPQAVGLGAFFGAALGFGLGWLLESIDKRFRAPEEIRNVLGLPILGHIPVIHAGGKRRQAKGAAAAMSSVLCVTHDRKGAQAEAYRAIRTAVYFSAQAEGMRVLQVTSPNPGDGKTTTAANLALSMAEAGKKILLVDADFRRPQVHEIMGIDNSVGLKGAIEGEVEIGDATRYSGMSNLWLMTSGGRPANPAELLTSARFKDLLDVVREQYDMVIVDTPPVLAVTDACAVAPRVDAVVMVLRLTANSRATATHAMDALTSIGAHVLGVIVNGVVSTTTPYGYNKTRDGQSKQRFGEGDYSFGKGGMYKHRNGLKYGLGHDYQYGNDRDEPVDGEDYNEHLAGDDGIVRPQNDAHDGHSTHEEGTREPVATGVVFRMTHTTVLLFTANFFGAAAVGYAQTLVVRAVAPRLGLTDRPDGHRKLHGTATPFFGRRTGDISGQLVRAGSRLLPRARTLAVEPAQPRALAVGDHLRVGRDCRARLAGRPLLSARTAQAGRPNRHQPLPRFERPEHRSHFAFRLRVRSGPIGGPAHRALAARRYQRDQPA